MIITLSEAFNFLISDDPGPARTISSRVSGILPVDHQPATKRSQRHHPARDKSRSRIRIDLEIRIDPEFQQLVDCDGMNNTFIHNARDAINEFYSSKYLSFLGRDVKVFPLCVTEGQVKMWGKHVVWSGMFWNDLRKTKLYQWLTLMFMHPGKIVGTCMSLS